MYIILAFHVFSIKFPSLFFLYTLLAVIIINTTSETRLKHFKIEKEKKKKMQKVTSAFNLSALNRKTGITELNLLII